MKNPISYTASYDCFVWEIQNDKGVIKYIAGIDLPELCGLLSKMTKRRNYIVRAVYADKLDWRCVYTPIVAYTDYVEKELTWTFDMPKSYNTLDSISEIYAKVVKSLKALPSVQEELMDELFA